MDQIFNRAIVNPSKLEARITGNAQLSSGVLGNALKIDASQSYVIVASANHRQECFGNLGLCPNGKWFCLYFSKVTQHLSNLNTLAL
ncbi:hypothetical protein DPMN_031321 [Dreissena polymorpha]|uniref:Uncharacterized protein n=1 Tax=Dreissena polymorpha TaxID=45954 RepID=A0A9D4M4E5_DREPO|nr:hypothetical protein DPMN_031321 [Dreissena polymorpha]